MGPYVTGSFKEMGSRGTGGQKTKEQKDRGIGEQRKQRRGEQLSLDEAPLSRSVYNKQAKNEVFNQSTLEEKICIFLKLIT
jgi:hypothetical protein